MFVFCRVSLDKSIPEYMSGLCVGATYFAVTLSTNKLLGSGVNPALTLPGAILNSDYGNLVIFLTAPFLGSLIGVFTYMILSLEIEAKKKVTFDARIAGSKHGSIDNQNRRFIEPEQLIEDKSNYDNVEDKFVEDDGEELIREQ